jgi:hypothetical protein
VLSANQAGYGVFEGGIFMASNISNSCTVWNAEVEPSHIGKLGSLEHLRPLLGKGASVAAGELIWITDRTPHESLPLPASTDCVLCESPSYRLCDVIENCEPTINILCFAKVGTSRQYFRLVTSNVSAW